MSSDQQQLEGIDVFLAFSVVGGTGAGIFYDYLHLISDTINGPHRPCGCRSTRWC